MVGGVSSKIHPWRKPRRLSYHRGSRRVRRKLPCLGNLGYNLRREFRKLRRRLSLRYFLALALVVFVAGGFYALFFSDLFALKKITVTILPHRDSLEEEGLKQEAKKAVYGKNLLFLSSHAFDFLHQDLSYESFKITKKWPDGLQVVVKKRIPRAVLEDSNGTLFLVDGQGIVFARGYQENLPVIKYPGAALSPGKSVRGEQVDFVLYIVKKVSESGLKMETLQLGLDTRLKLPEGTLVLLRTGDKASVDKLLKILGDFGKRGVALSKIDLRYQQPVIEYK